MNNWKEALLSESTSIVDALKVIDNRKLQIGVVIDGQGKLLGTVTDGDVRRAILAGVGLDESIGQIMNQKPISSREGTKRKMLIRSFRKHQVRQLPVLSKTGEVIGLELLDTLQNPEPKDNAVILMAGGLGTRLRPLTDECPKPMLNIGGRPILETIINNFMDSGYREFYLSVNYRSEVIKSYFGDGSSFGANIQYLEETQRLGTVGALSLLPETPDKPFFVMNSDLLTRVNFGQMMDFHHLNRSMATMGVREYSYEIPYGVLKLHNHEIQSIVEKPVQQHFVNGGIYIFEPEVIDYIPKDQYYDMPTLFETLMSERKQTCAFPFREYWMDIGHPEDFERANRDYSKEFLLKAIA
ncbi:MAG: nucleotidyltransferase family protein [Pseudomonadales bacterium]|nr:nucleotidyltransferase family protein [Pseudomonadales bacterium]